MMRVFGPKKEKEHTPSLRKSSDRINKRGDTIDEKIKRLDAELAIYKNQIKKTRPGPAQEAIKARATRVLKQKRMYEGQRDMLCNQTFNLDQVAFAADGIKDAQQTNLQDEMLDLMDVSNEIQESLGRSYELLMTLMRMNSCVAVDELGLPAVLHSEVRYRVADLC